jgi:hypothetical protein
MLWNSIQESELLNFIQQKLSTTKTLSLARQNARQKPFNPFFLPSRGTPQTKLFSSNELL